MDNLTNGIFRCLVLLIFAPREWVTKITTQIHWQSQNFRFMERSTPWTDFGKHIHGYLRTKTVVTSSESQLWSMCWWFRTLDERRWNQESVDRFECSTQRHRLFNGRCNWHNYSILVCAHHTQIRRSVLCWYIEKRPGLANNYISPFFTDEVQSESGQNAIYSGPKYLFGRDPEWGACFPHACTYLKWLHWPIINSYSKPLIGTPKIFRSDRKPVLIHLRFKGVDVEQLIHRRLNTVLACMIPYVRAVVVSKTSGISSCKSSKVSQLLLPLTVSKQFHAIVNFHMWIEQTFI